MEGEDGRCEDGPVEVPLLTPAFAPRPPRRQLCRPVNGPTKPTTDYPQPTLSVSRFQSEVSTLSSRPRLPSPAPNSECRATLARMGRDLETEVNSR